MEYTNEVLDRRTGELVTVSAGDWITITELGDQYSVSRVKVRAILRLMDFLYVEGGGAHNRHRLTPWVIAGGFGKHVPSRRKGQYPFDVVSPEGQAWIAQRWCQTVEVLEADRGRPIVADARNGLQAFKDDRGRQDLNVQGCVLWLIDHYPDLTHTETATILEVSQQLVSRYLNIRNRQLKAARLSRDKPLERIVKACVSPKHLADLMPSGGARSITYAYNTSENVLSL